jgi:pimeloyl-ACP methyl ester carboxylesterase
MPFEPPEDPRAARRGAITRWVSFALVIILVVLVGYLGVVGYIGSDQLANPPEHSTDCRTPAIAEGWVYEAVNYDVASDGRLADVADPLHCPPNEVKAGTRVETADGVRIAAWYIPAGDGAPASGPTVVLAHGYGQNKSTMLPWAELLHDHYNLVLLDFRNHGQSTGSQTTQGVLEANDLRAVVDWLDKAKKPRQLALLGVSMGGASALHEAVGDSRVDAVILDSTHATLANAVQARLTRQGYPLALPAAWGILLGGLIRTGQDMSTIDPVGQIARLHRPVLIIVGGRDDAIGPHDGQDLLDAARAGADAGPSSSGLDTCADAGHAQAVERCRSDYRGWVLGFLERSLAP